MSDGRIDHNDTCSASNKRKRPVKEANQKAKVKKLATAVVLTDSATSEKSGVDEKILERIKKCFDRGNHTNTPETEAKAALRMGAKLMSQYNVTQAELIERTDDKEKALLAGQSVVEIIATTGRSGKVRKYGFTCDLAYAMQVFFDCKCYSVARARSIEWTFYGIASNTAAAAMAFEMAHNLIQGWALEKKGISIKHSYTLGVSAGLLRTARKEKKEELRIAEKAEAETTAKRSEEEKAQCLRDIERLRSQIQQSESEDEDEDSEELRTKSNASQEDTDAQSNPQTEPDSDAESDISVGAPPDFTEEAEIVLNPYASFEDEVSKFRQQAEAARKKAPLKKKAPKPPKAPEQEQTRANEKEPTTELAKTWASGMQLMRFRNSALKIAEDYLAAQKIKLSRSQSRTAAVRDWESFREGQEDSKKIDVRSVGNKRIEDGKKIDMRGEGKTRSGDEPKSAVPTAAYTALVEAQVTDPRSHTAH